MLHRSFILRQITRSGRQSLVFVLCVTLSIVTLVALSGFRSSVNQAVLEDARALHGGDIIIHSHQPLSDNLARAVADWEARGELQSVKTYEFYSVVRVRGTHRTLLAGLKVVEPGYPLYGSVDLQSGRSLDDVLVQGDVIVESSLLDRLAVRLGDVLHVGSTTLTIRDVVLREPDRPVNLFSFGPRILVASADLEALDLIGKGSRIQVDTLVRLRDAGKLEMIAEDLQARSAGPNERVDTYRTARSRVKKFFDNFLFFLTLISAFTLLLAGIGIQSVLAAFLKEKEKTVAVMKTVGATSRFITAQFVAVLGLLGLLGTLAGLALGSLLQTWLPELFRGLVPSSVQPSLSWRMATDGFILGILVVALFAFLPLNSLNQVKPGAILRKQSAYSSRGLPAALTVLAILAALLGIILKNSAQDLGIALGFVLGVAAFIAAAALIAQGVLLALRRARTSSLAFRQALRGLFRPRNATRSIIITLTASLSILFSISLIERNIDATFVQSFPPDSPNVFFIDIQPSQLEEFKEVLGFQAEYHPVVRGRVARIGGVDIDVERERQSRGDNLSREFNLTFRDHLSADESLVKGDGLFRSDWDGPQVSVLDTVLEMRAMDVGDSIIFMVQGVPIEARISSIRSRKGELIQPFFYFVFQEPVLRDAPQTIFTALRVPKEDISALQSRVVSRFHNVSVFDVTQAVSTLAGLMEKLSGITRFFTFFSILAGILIIVSSILATRYARIQEAVYFKILGARSGFILKVLTLENIVLGMVSGLLALGFSQAATWLVSARWLEIPYRPFLVPSLVMVAATVALVTAAGLLSSISILRQRPVIFLREQTEE
ncbi:MAG: FtsX-like permease family protein [Syntrophobacteraceae bacterium]|jgi:putative ABC transport system permease protein|nr:FtsX-like permease family protein [Syntrophobacteraceae bacterium]